MIRIIALTDAGKRLGSRLAQQLADSEFWYKPQPFTEKVQQAFSGGDRLILICAMGIAVRTLAPVIRSKYEDPAVLVLDEAGRFVVPLLSGHEGGANHWGQEIAELLGSELVVTTAKPYLNPVYTVGMGCERDCPKEELEALLIQCLNQAGLSIEDIDSIHSIDIKADEAGLMALAEQLGKPFCTWNKDHLSSVEDLLSTRSEYVFKTVGVYGVAESAALYGAENLTGESSELLLPKQKNRRATCAIARSYASASTDSKDKSTS
ncbi:cobalamin biosynthesis protein CbiG [Hahella sp. CCB-MM4]|uniref:cobalt-precorrin 5A hydrolase n=1 Tax=Hahella sp. (strain CCB-MM4) TaxID=1926491 RepID=UPI000B9B7A29|nr:cobalamin biosynthesis protein [Hahella sp. CCB-MM4]OZG72705.1 cobalamin biosynthesis protein CbiG [Hahella sp. CCB-MM4]